MKIIDGVYPNIRNQFSIAKTCINTPSVLALASTFRCPFTKIGMDKKEGSGRRSNKRN